MQKPTAISTCYSMSHCADNWLDMFFFFTEYISFSHSTDVWLLIVLSSLSDKEQSAKSDLMFNTASKKQSRKQREEGGKKKDSCKLLLYFSIFVQVLCMRG